MSEREISIIGLEESRDLGSLNRFKYRRDKVKVSDLKKHIKEFLEDMQTFIDEAPVPQSGFYLDAIEIHANVSAKGTISLLGTGGELGGGGGIKFILKRSKSE